MGMLLVYHEVVGYGLKRNYIVVCNLCETLLTNSVLSGCKTCRIEKGLSATNFCPVITTITPSSCDVLHLGPLALTHK